MKWWSCIGVLIMAHVAAQEFRIWSNDFKANDAIPKECTCDGRNMPPSLHWENAPENTVSFALICDDPDAPTKEPWVHWVVFNIPGVSITLPQNLARQKKLVNGIMQGKNTQNKIGYDGPCPPPGKIHHYHFKLFALDTLLDLQPGATKEMVLQAIKGHILAQAEVVGLYTR